MLQYLINATAIWLLSLLVFDIFLRRESFHGYNRVYLLTTLLLGALLPLWQWQDVSMPMATGEGAVARVLHAKRAIVDSSDSSATAAGNLPWLAIIYFLGVAVAVILLFIDIVKLATFYGNGKVTPQHGWNIVETGRSHAPFSFRKKLFVHSIAQYSAEEWAMILLHEHRHTTLWHLADMVLLQLARIVFWFHPLVYIYQRRMLLVHEYQADGASAKQPQAYGRFLVEQAILQSAPNIAHSFNRSPIKKRIVMLTRRSTTASKLKMLFILPLLVVCALCFTKNSFAQKFERHGNKVTYRGNTFEYTPQSNPDTVELTDPVTGKSEIKYIVKNSIPVKMNGKKLLNTDEVTTQAEPPGKYKRIENHILRALNSEFEKLPDGSYMLDLHEIVLDNMGKIVFYEYNGISGKGATQAPPEEIKKAIMNKIDDIILSAPVYKPAKANGKAVPVRTDIFLSDYKIEISNHHVSLWQQTF